MLAVPWLVISGEVCIVKLNAADGNHNKNSSFFICSPAYSILLASQSYMYSTRTQAFLLQNARHNLNSFFG